jgi:dTDP-4-amino-4,6-dideoxygalactose transaminase
MDRIWDHASRHNLVVIEDAAHAVGTEYKGKQIGSGRSEAVAFSFYATKNLTTGEGGMLTTHDGSLADRMKTLCLHGISRDAWERYSDKGNWYYEVTECGFKYNLSDIQSAIGIHQLRKQEEFIRVRARYASLYRELLSDLEEVEVPCEDSHGRSSWHLYLLRLRLDKVSIDREQFIQQMREKGVGTSVHFIPIPLHPLYQRYPQLSASSCPSAMALYDRLISLPLYPAMSESDVEYVAGSVRSVVQSARRELFTGATA